MVKGIEVECPPPGLISVASANVRALLMNVNTPQHRGSVFAIYNFADNLGKGVGPALGGLILAPGCALMQFAENGRYNVEYRPVADTRGGEQQHEGREERGNVRGAGSRWQAEERPDSGQEHDDEID